MSEPKTLSELEDYIGKFLAFDTEKSSVFGQIDRFYKFGADKVAVVLNNTCYCETDGSLSRKASHVFEWEAISDAYVFEPEQALMENEEFFFATLGAIDDLPKIGTKIKVGKVPKALELGGKLL